MIKLSDFATLQGVSKRAVQISLKKYEAELEGHFERQGQNGTYIDAYAQEFLRSKMLKNPVVVYDEKTLPFYEEMQATRKENDDLQRELTDVYKQLANVSEMRLQLQAQIIELKVLSAGKEEAERKAAEIALELAEARARAESAEKENAVLISKKIDVELALTAAEEENKTLADVAELNAQEAAREKQRANDNAAELEKIGEFSLFEFIRYKRRKRYERKEDN